MKEVAGDPGMQQGLLTNTKSFTMKTPLQPKIIQDGMLYKKNFRPFFEPNNN